MSDPAVLVERDGPVVTLTLNRPDKKNAFNCEMLCRLCDAWDMIDADDGGAAALPALRRGGNERRRRRGAGAHPHGRGRELLGGRRPRPPGGRLDGGRAGG